MKVTILAFIFLAAVDAAAQSEEFKASCKMKFPAPVIPVTQDLTLEENLYLSQGIGNGFKTAKELARISSLFQNLQPKLATTRDTLKKLAEAQRAAVDRSAADSKLQIGRHPAGGIWFAGATRSTDVENDCGVLRYSKGKTGKELEEIWITCRTSLKSESQNADLNPDSWTSIQRAKLALDHAHGLEAYYSNCGISGLQNPDDDCTNEQKREGKLALAKSLAAKAEKKFDEFTEKLQCEMIAYNNVEKEFNAVEAQLEFMKNWESDPKKLLAALSTDYSYALNTKNETGDAECAKKYVYPVIPIHPKYSDDEIRFLTTRGFVEIDNGGSSKYLAPIDDKYRTSNENQNLRTLLKDLEPKLLKIERPLDLLFDQRVTEAKKEAARLGLKINDEFKISEENLGDTSAFSISSIDEMTPQRWTAFKAHIANLSAANSLDPKTWTTPAKARQAWQLALLKNDYYKVCGLPRLSDSNPDCKNDQTRENKRKKMEEAQLKANEVANNLAMKLQCDLEFLNRVKSRRQTIKTNIQIVNATKQKVVGVEPKIPAANQ